MTSIISKMGDLENVLITLYRCCDLREIFFTSNCTFSFHDLTFKVHFHNTGASYHRPDSV